MARVLISMSNDFLSKVDNVASSEQRTRSELIREALHVYIKRNKISNNRIAWLAALSAPVHIKKIKTDSDFESV